MQLELGGKGANIIFDDAPLDEAVHGSAYAIFHNQGQACIAGSRLLVQDAIADKFLDRFLTLTRSLRVGNPLDRSTEMGPLTSAGHRDRVKGYIDVAREQGSTILTGGKPPANPTLAAGYYIEPTVVTAKPEDRVCQEEVFGPFVSVTRFKDEAEAIRNALDKLPLPQREVLSLFFLEEFSGMEIAAIVDAPPGTVKSRLFYGKKALFEALKQEIDHDR